jgi:hypothetical protein
MITFRLIFLLSCLAAASTHAQDLKTRLAATGTTDNIREFCSRFRQFGEQHEATYTTDKTKLFVAWVQPKESATPAFLFAYVFRDGEWHLLLDYPETIQFASDTVAISVAERFGDFTTLEIYHGKPPRFPVQ